MRADAPQLGAVDDAPQFPCGRVVDVLRPGALDEPPPAARDATASRLVAAAVSLALHAALFGWLALRVVDLPAATASIEVELVNESEAAEAPAAAPVPQELPPPEPPAQASPPPPEPTPEPTPTPTPTPEPPPTPEPTPAPTPPPVLPPRAETTRKSLAPPRRPAPARPRAAAAAAAEAATLAEGNGAALGAARADYGALAVAQIRAHKFYPAAALAAHETGEVGVLFVVAASGRIASVTIVRSSGSETLDQAARAIVAAIELPPPPGGFYSGATRLDFVAP